MASFISPRATLVIAAADPWNTGGRRLFGGCASWIRRLCSSERAAADCSLWTELGPSQLMQVLDTSIVLIEKHLTFQQHLPRRLSVVVWFRCGWRRSRLRGRVRPGIRCLRFTKLLEPVRSSSGGGQP